MAAFLNIRLLLFLFALFTTFWLLPIPGAVVYPLLALYALRGPKQVIEAYAIMFLILLGNYALIPRGGMAFRWLVIFAGFGTALWHVIAKGHTYALRSRINFVMLIFFLCMLPLSIVSSKIPIISVLKLLGFFCGVWAIVSSFYITAATAIFWKKWFSAYFSFIVLFSGVMLLAGLGYERNNLGFQGIFSHPQVFGPICGVIAAWFSGRAFFTEKQPFWVTASALLSWFFIYLSQARTAVIAAMGGFLLALIIFFFRGKKVQTSGRSTLVTILTFILLIALSIGQIFRPGQIFNEFVQKRIPSTNIVEVIQESRGALIRESMQNYRAHPTLGIGFGIPSDYEAGTFGSSETFMGIPVAASVEKGFLPSAVLEEMGILGAFFTMLILWAIMSTSARYLSFSTYWLLLSTLLINVGEAVFFSLGGPGLFLWIIVGLAVNQSRMENVVQS